MAYAVPMPDALRGLLADVQGRASGLRPDEVRERQNREGKNRLPAPAATSMWRIFGRQLVEPLALLLALAALLSLGVHRPVDALFIVGVLVFNAGLAGFEEARAERKCHALASLVRSRATVLREGKWQEVDGEDVVRGDILALVPGQRVPADARLIECQGLELDESMLTGESVPVAKAIAPPRAAPHPGLAQADRVYAGTHVERGRGVVLVYAIAAATLAGQLATQIAGITRARAPLQVRMERFTRTLLLGVLVAAAILVALGTLWRGLELVDTAIFAVALAVSAVPEGLPVAITVALAVAGARMANRGAWVRRLHAVEGLGSCTLIATDKTGTLTRNELSAQVLLGPEGQGLPLGEEGNLPEPARVPRPDEGPALPLHPWRIARVAGLCSEGRVYEERGTWRGEGDPTDVALLVLAHKLGFRPEEARATSPCLVRRPFEPEYRYAAAWHRAPAGSALVFVQGAPERVVPMCQRSASVEPGAADALDRARALQVAHDFAAAGYRVIAFAEGEAAEPPPAGRGGPGAAEAAPRGLCLLGFVGLMDPLRAEAPSVIEGARAAGLGVWLVTGDHPATALAIARELGLANALDEVHSGADIDEWARSGGPSGLPDQAVFARVAPAQKHALVTLAQSRGHFVAVTGDGVNDAAALRAAHVGVAMGRSGTDVARESADVVLSDDNLATLLAGIAEGRVAYDNVRKVIALLVATGAAEVILAIASLVAGLPVPLLPAQLLWLNLVTNGVQDVALAFEPPEGDVLHRPPRPPRERVIDRLLLERTLLSALCIGAASFFLWQHDLGVGLPEGEARNRLLLLLVFFENVHVANVRSERRSLFVQPWRQSPWLISGILAALALHVLALHTPLLQRALGTQPVGGADALLLGALALSAAVVVEAHKLFWRVRARRATLRTEPLRARR